MAGNQKWEKAALQKSLLGSLAVTKSYGCQIGRLAGSYSAIAFILSPKFFNLFLHLPPPFCLLYYSTNSIYFCTHSRPDICHKPSQIIFVDKKSVMWRNFKYLNMTDLRNFRFLHIYNLCDVVLFKMLLNLLFTLFCREIYFATIYAPSWGEKLSSQVHWQISGLTHPFCFHIVASI